MSSTDPGLFSTDEVTCARHPKTLTRLRCSRCGTPICPQCAVRTPVGLRCPDCAGVRGLPTYSTPGTSLAKGLAVGAALAIAFALLFAWIPQWNFYLSLALAFGVAEAIAWAAKEQARSRPADPRHCGRDCGHGAGQGLPGISRRLHLGASECVYSLCQGVAADGARP